MAKNELCFDFERKKNFEKCLKIFHHFYTKTMPKTPKNQLCFDFWKKFSKIFFWNFSSFLYQNHTQKCLKWARMTSFLNFEQIHRFWTNLIFPSFDPVWAQTRLKLPKSALFSILEAKNFIWALLDFHAQLTQCFPDLRFWLFHRGLPSGLNFRPFLLWPQVPHPFI